MQATPLDSAANYENDFMITLSACILHASQWKDHAHLMKGDMTS